MTRILASILPSIAALLLLAASTVAQQLQPIQLPPAQTSGGKPLMETLRSRRTAREFNTEKLRPQVLANLLWAGFGINRSQTGQRTAPSAMNSQEIDIYVALAEGLFVYDATQHQLKQVMAGDIRAKAGGQETFKAAPLTLIYVADLAKLAKAPPDTRRFYAGFDAGCICQNVYLYCASEGLATVAHDLNRSTLTEAMKLKPDQEIILAQAVGFPKPTP
ncbi:MAG TPA: SagB/ThcOx family dehydrogenase [Patescibacteria group bacterium]|nr:SagB/ThcOx family dehydrogenase [Patescibacteria group bacterium]